MTAPSHQRVDDAIAAIAAINIDGLQTREMLAALGYLATLIILTDKHPDVLLEDFIAHLDRDVRHQLTHH